MYLSLCVCVFITYCLSIIHGLWYLSNAITYIPQHMYTQYVTCTCNIHSICTCIMYVTHVQTHVNINQCYYIMVNGMVYNILSPCGMVCTFNIVWSRSVLLSLFPIHVHVHTIDLCACFCIFQVHIHVYFSLSLIIIFIIISLSQGVPVWTFRVHVCGKCSHVLWVYNRCMRTACSYTYSVYYAHMI